MLNFNLYDQSHAITRLNQDLCRISNFTFNNQLFINPDKTKFIVFSNRAMTAKLEDFCLTLLGKEHLPVNSIKDLGVILDSNLTYNDHIASTVSICMSCLGQINRVKHSIDRNTLTIVINALVLSKLYYCTYVWCKTNLTKVQAVQNFACRIISNKRKYDHVTPILKGLRWLPVGQQLYYLNAIMAFRCMTGCAPDPQCSRFIQNLVSPNAPQETQLLQIPLWRIATGQRSFHYRAVKL